jgi:hypothetical protein
MRSGHKSRLWLAGALALLSAVGSRAKDEPTPSEPAQLVARAVQNEIDANGPGGTHFMFRNERKTAHTNQVKLMVETRESTAGMLIEMDGHALSPQERQQEESRLQNYVQNPEQLNRKRKQEKEDSERTMRIVKALPAAFIYEKDGTQRGTSSVGSPQDELVRLKFRPNPKYDPPSRVEQVLTGMHGHLLVDAKQARLAEIDGTLEKEVGFGWGILGHLDRGGRFLVQQGDVGNRQWELTRMELSFTGKMLFFKKLNIRSTDTFSDFRPVAPDLTFAQGVALLEKEAARIQGHNSHISPTQGPSKQPTDDTKEEAEQTICCDK